MTQLAIFVNGMMNVLRGAHSEKDFGRRGRFFLYEKLYYFLPGFLRYKMRNSWYPRIQILVPFFYEILHFRKFI